MEKRTFFKKGQKIKKRRENIEKTVNWESKGKYRLICHLYIDCAINNQLSVKIVPLQLINGGPKAMLSCNYFIGKDDRPRRLKEIHINEINFSHFSFGHFLTFPIYISQRYIWLMACMLYVHLQLQKYSWVWWMDRGNQVEVFHLWSVHFDIELGNRLAIVFQIVSNIFSMNFLWCYFVCTKKRMNVA